jgi:hypothetical protein
MRRIPIVALRLFVSISAHVRRAAGKGYQGRPIIYNSSRSSLICDENNEFGASNFRRPLCLDPGTYFADSNGALHTTAKGFFSYGVPDRNTNTSHVPLGEWKQILEGVDPYDTGNGWRWRLPGECSLVDFTPEFLCDSMHALYARQKKFGSQSLFDDDPGRSVDDSLTLNMSVNVDNHNSQKTNQFFSDPHWHGRPVLVFVGDSIVGGQLHSLYLSPSKLRPVIDHIGKDGFSSVCGVTVRSFRSDRLKDIVPWAEGVCRSTVSIINYGAHALDFNNFISDLSMGASSLNRKCGNAIRSGRVRVYFRTTPEGNPWCNSKEHTHPANMSVWSEETWRVLSGERPPPDPDLFKLEWRWNLFQKFNEAAIKLLRPMGIHVMDVVPMTRLRPTTDWGQRPGKSFDCLHGNAAVHEWNTLLANVIAADMCLNHTN